MKESIKKFVTLFLFLFLNFGFSFAQDAEITVTEKKVAPVTKAEAGLDPPPIDKSTINLRKFDAEKLEEYRRSGRFNYSDDPDYETNWFRKLWWKFLKWLEDRVGYENSAVLGKVIKWALVALGIGVLLYFLLKASGNSIIKKERKDNFVHLEILDETVSEETLDQLLAAAIKSGEHRAAIRIYFLMCLRRLDDNEEIVWRDNKTNLEYRSEISNEVLSAPFGELVDIYEHVWYGEFEVAENEYQVYTEQFSSFLDKLSKVKA